MKDIEIWKDIPGYEGFYQISSLGEVKSLDYRHKGIEKILKPGKKSDGFLTIELWKYGCRKTYRIHRLMAKTFLDDCSESMEVYHLDSNKHNNDLSNLKMCVRKEACNTKLVATGKSSRPVVCIDNGVIYKSAKQVEEALGVHRCNVTNACRGDQKTAGGYRFKYYEPQKNEVI